MYVSVYVLMMILSQIEYLTEYKIKLIFIFETLSQPYKPALMKIRSPNDSC